MGISPLIPYPEKHEQMRQSKFDLSVDWSEKEIGGGLIVSFESGIGQWRHLENRFMQVITHFLGGINPPSAVLNTEIEQVLAWGRGECNPLREACLHELFKDQADVNTTAIALIDKEGSMRMSYSELERKSDIVAWRLQCLGVKPDMFVGLLIDKSFGMIVGMIGILKSGGVYVPIDPTFPEERMKFIAQDSCFDVLVTQRKYEDLGMVKGTESLVYYIDEYIVPFDEEEDKIGNEMKVIRTVKPSNLAYMIYTSGTTGSPKGVKCSHQGSANMLSLELLMKNGCIGSNAVGLCHNIIFNGSVDTIFSTLGSGLTLSLDMKKCTMLDCTPSRASLHLEDPTNNIHTLIVIGEACQKGLESKCKNYINRYGPTDCSITCTSSKTSETIGRPLPNVLCYVVNVDDGSLCPPGVSGELWIGGVGVSQGYHNRQELISKKFVSNPFESNGNIYKSGDRVKWNNQGEFVYLGRFDFQVKIRGYRIELGEIESSLESQESVSGAIVLPYKSGCICDFYINR